MANQPSTGGPTLGPSATAQATSANSENPSGSKESKETLDSTSKIWDSERQIVKSLWKLQELEAKVSLHMIWHTDTLRIVPQPSSIC